MAKTVLASAAIVLLGMGVVVLLVESEQNASLDIAATIVTQAPSHARNARGRLHCAADLRCTQAQDVATLR